MTDDELLAQPVIVTGSPRSGTTLLCQVLRNHPDLHLVEEPRLIWKYGNESKSDVLQRSDARPGVRDYIRREFARRVREAGKSRLLEKSPNNALRLDFVDEVFPDGRIVHIIRSAVPSILSIREFWKKHATGLPGRHLSKRAKEMRLRQLPYYVREFTRRALARRLPGVVKPPVWGSRLPGMDEMVRDLDLLEVCCLQWRWSVEAACRDGRKLPPDRYLECRLEQLDRARLEQILKFFELPASSEVIQAFEARFNPAQPNARVDAADPADVARIRAWTAPTMEWLERAAEEPTSGGG